MNTNKILIIDDDADDVEILSDVFARCGLENVDSVFSTKQAFLYLEAITNARDLPQLIITDYYLPGNTGADFLASLRSMEDYKHIKVLVLSTVKTEKEMERLKELGAVDYLAKPSSYEEFAKVAKDVKERLLV